MGCSSIMFPIAQAAASSEICSSATYRYRLTPPTTKNYAVNHSTNTKVDTWLTVVTYDQLLGILKQLYSYTRAKPFLLHCKRKSESWGTLNTRRYREIKTGETPSTAPVIQNIAREAIGVTIVPSLHLLPAEISWCCDNRHGYCQSSNDGPSGKHQLPYFAYFPLNCPKRDK